MLPAANCFCLALLFVMGYTVCFLRLCLYARPANDTSYNLRSLNTTVSSSSRPAQSLPITINLTICFSSFHTNRTIGPRLVMQSTPSGRRYAIVPGTATPPPELAQRLLSRTIGQPRDFAPLSRTLEGPAGENAALALNPKSRSTDQESGAGSFSWTCSETTLHQDLRAWDSGSTELGKKGFELSSHEEKRRISSSGACKAHGALRGDRRDKKRKHAAPVQEQGRRFLGDVSEDTPHMSEIDSDDGIKPAYGDVFDGRRHRGSMRDQASKTSALEIPRSYDGPYSRPSTCAVSPRDTSSLGGRPLFWGC
ncbi:MAG: hypothetical protein FRX48_04725 [Lasallia pustulata]|uniref:Uncharacterized protein n=1 Tax=Lasallia pustulata TaxID=136370 RepID=A0A5M8PR63_9LECA|nr:MAG: hypothetical protein FRX48_04725 [Lasallia pustulata]